MDHEYDIAAFANAMKEEDSIIRIIEKVDREIDQMSEVSHLVKGAVHARASGSLAFRNQLRRLLHLARSGELKPGASFRESGAYRSLFEDLVSRNLVHECVLDNWREKRP